MSFFQGVDDFPIIQPDDAVKAHAVDLKKLGKHVRLCLVCGIVPHRCFPSLWEVAAVGFVAAFRLDFCDGSGMLFDPIDKTAFQLHLVIAVGFGKVDCLGSGDLVHDCGIVLVCLALHDSGFCLLSWGRL